MILLIDNYDSFTYNLYQYIGTINEDIVVVRNDKITIQEIKEMNPSHIIISPGPKFPADAGISIDTIKTFYDAIPILGVCLGHQSIGEAFGGKTVHASEIFHGKASQVILEDSPIFNDIPKSIKVARYHSLVIEQESIPKVLKVIAKTEDGKIMGVAHKEYPVFGIQFHPESIITEFGLEMIENFLKL